MEKGEMARIAEKVKFWEEQDRINKALIPRVLKNHDLIVELSSNLSKYSNNIIQLERKINELKDYESIETLEIELARLETKVNKLESRISKLENCAKLEKDSELKGSNINFGIIAISCLALLISIVNIFV